MYDNGDDFLGLTTTIKGVHIDTQSPQSHIDERMAKAAILKEQAASGNVASWEQLWLASGRTLPVRVPVASAPQNGAAGWPRVKPQLTVILQDLERDYGSPYKATSVPPVIGYPQAPINLPGGGVQQPPLYGPYPSTGASGTAQAGLFSNPLVTMSLAGLGLFVLSQFTSDGGSSRRSRRRR